MSQRHRRGAFQTMRQPPHGFSNVTDTDHFSSKATFNIPAWADCERHNPDPNNSLTLTYSFHAHQAPIAPQHNAAKPRLSPVHRQPEARKTNNALRGTSCSGTDNGNHNRVGTTSDHAVLDSPVDTDWRSAPHNHGEPTSAAEPRSTNKYGKKTTIKPWEVFEDLTKINCR